MSKITFVLTACALLISPLAFSDEVVVKDGDTTLTHDELAYSLTEWTPQMRESAIQDKGDRLELLSAVLANKKIAEQADKVVQQHPDLRWQYQAGLQAYQRNFVLRQFNASIVLPDFTKLAKERYNTDKDKYALIPETRISSQILISSPPGQPRDAALAEANEVLQQLRNGADFLEMVKEHSDEPNAVEKKGKFDRWIRYGEIGVTPRYSEALFSIEKVGEYSEPVQSQFGVHIIRLDGIREKSYKPFDEVKDTIIKELETEYRRLALKDYAAQFQLSKDATIDGAAVEQLLAPYAKQE